jgi:hypothetical protein
MTVHRDYANKSCPGTWLYERHGQIAAEVNKLLGAANQKQNSGNAAKVQQGCKVPDVYYQVHTAGGKWLPNVKNVDDFAGLENKPIDCIKANLSTGHIRYRVHIIGGKWLPWVTDREDYAGLYGQQIDCVQMELSGLSGYDVEYRVSTAKSAAYLPWVRGWNSTNDEGYAGIYGVAFDKLQIRIVKK